MMRNKGSVYKKHIVIVVLFSILVIVGAGLFQLSKSGNPRNAVFASWRSMQPQDKSISLNSSDQSFIASFNNAQVTNIDIKGVSATEEISASNCVRVAVNGIDPAVSSGINVPVGSSFRIEASCPDAKKRIGDAYTMKISIEYSTSVGGINTRTETGYIKGTAE
jgi:hypothetical protein